MTTITTTIPRMTAEEFFDWVQRPENDNQWFELERGEVIEWPPPNRQHGVVCANVGYFLGNYLFERGHGYVVGNNAGVILERDPDTVRGPDVAYYEDAQAFAELHPKFGEVAPRLAVAVLSPSDRADRVNRKITDYLANGVALVWLVDPDSRWVTVFRQDSGPRVVEGDQELTGDEVLPEFRCRVAELFLLPGEKLESKPAAKPPRKRRRSEG